MAYPAGIQRQNNPEMYQDQCIQQEKPSCHPGSASCCALLWQTTNWTTLIWPDQEKEAKNPTAYYANSFQFWRFLGGSFIILFSSFWSNMTYSDRGKIGISTILSGFCKGVHSWDFSSLPPAKKSSFKNKQILKVTSLLSNLTWLSFKKENFYRAFSLFHIEGTDMNLLNVRGREKWLNVFCCPP